MTAEAPQATRSSWASATERGSVLGLRFLVFCYLGIGRRATGLLLYPTVAYFVLVAGPARRASRRYLEHLYGRGSERLGQKPPGLREVFRHFMSFAELTLDRVCFWTGRYSQFAIEMHNVEEVNEGRRAGRGVILLGAHLGSFDVLRVMARDAKVTVNAVMFTDNAERINSIFKQLDPEADIRVIQMDPGSVRSAFEIKSCLERGEVVALLGDRAAPGGRGRRSPVSFLGKETQLPEGPFLLPLLFGSPVFLSLALRTGPRRYEIFFESLGAGARVPAARRRDELRGLMESFAKRLEHYCQLEPFQWFNFYDYWGEDSEGDR
jgi:predicted LPLAT superfamily acyltransferase